MSNERDEYDQYDFSEFTEEDFAKIDASITLEVPAQGVQAPGNISGGPAITVEVEQPTDYTAAPMKDASTSSNLGSHTLNPAKSPFRQYRAYRNAFSVTDLVGPVWCEVQFDYGLSQQRHRKLESRPTSFTSSTGKLISVEHKVAASNDQRVKRGKSIHKTLEREIRPEAVKVKITSEDERWALRLVDMLACLRDLLSSRGCAREMPVFGIVHGQVVTGIIDEIQRKPIPERASPGSTKRGSSPVHGTPTPKRTRRSRSPALSTEKKLAAVPKEKTDDTPPAECIPSTPPNAPQLPRYTLHLIDTKTRNRPDLPPHEDTRSSRLQLMIYHRLLSGLISQSSPFDFHSWWTRLKVNPSRIFSLKFMTDAGLITSVDEVSGYIEGLSCLNDLTQAWSNELQNLDVNGVEEQLQLVYRKRKGTRILKGKQKTVGVPVSQEEQDIAKAVEQSLKEVGYDAGFDSGFAAAIARSIKDSDPGEGSSGTEILGSLVDGETKQFTEDPELAWALQQSLLKVGQNVEVDKTDVSSDESSLETPTGGSGADVTKNVPSSGPKIIGTKEFLLDNIFLDTHLADVLKYWLGQRAPRGVEVAQSVRCFSCEYQNGCEWREHKAAEAAKKLELKGLQTSLAEI